MSWALAISVVCAVIWSVHGQQAKYNQYLPKRHPNYVRPDQRHSGAATFQNGQARYQRNQWNPAPTTKDGDSGSAQDDSRSDAVDTVVATATPPVVAKKIDAVQAKAVVDLDEALSRWHDVQQKKYYAAGSSAYNEQMGLDDDTVVVYVAESASTGSTLQTSSAKSPLTTASPLKPASGSLLKATGGVPEDQHLLSFVEVCQADSKKLCNDPNPFLSATCLQLHRAALSPLCAEYHSAKMNCFLDITRLALCPDPAKKFECLEANKMDVRLGKPCSESKFMRYLRTHSNEDKKLALDHAHANAKATDEPRHKGNATVNGTFASPSSSSKGSDAATNKTASTLAMPSKIKSSTAAPTQPVTTKALPSFTDACADDAFRLCNSRNAFAASVCLGNKRTQLSPLCLDYHDAKQACYDDLRRLHLCSAPRQTLFMCLDQNRDAPDFSVKCKTSQFMQYMRNRPRKASEVAKGNAAPSRNDTTTIASSVVHEAKHFDSKV
jgi:hypothetical protein